jgi:hypothetical protein
MSRIAWMMIAALLAAPAGAQSLKELRARQAEEAALAREAAYTSAVCGRTIATRIDWSSARGWPEDESLAAACDGALGALEAACRAGRRDVREFVCAGDGSGPTRSGATLRYGAAPQASGFAETKAYLETSQ